MAGAIVGTEQGDRGSRVVARASRRNGPAVPQRRAVDLSERCRGDRLRFERCKDGREGTTQLRRENRFNLGEGKWLDPILKTPERLQVLRGKQVATG